MILFPFKNSEQDIHLYCYWCNDHDTRRFSFHQDLKDPNVEKWKIYRNVDTYMWGVDEMRVKDEEGSFLLGLKVGFIHWEPFHNSPFDDETAVQISICIAPEYRRQGYGIQLLRKATRHLHKLGHKQVVALIKHDNAPATALFDRAKYKLTGQITYPVKHIGRVPVRMMEHVAK